MSLFADETTDETDHSLDPEEVNESTPLVPSNYQPKLKFKTRAIVTTVILCLTCVLFNVGMNVLFFVMGQVMLDYPQFLNWGQATLNWLLYIGWVLIRSIYYRMYPEKHFIKKPVLSRPLHFYYFGLGFLVFLNGELVQQADPKVSGSWQSFLSILGVPLTGVFARYWPGIKQKFSRSKLIGSIIVVIGVSIAVIIPQFTKETNTSSGPHPPGWNSPLWITLFTLSLFPGVVQSVWTEQLFELGVDPLSLLMWRTFYAIPMYILYLPFQGLFIGQHSVWDNQRLAIQCFFNVHDIPGCSPNAWIYVVSFVVCYGILSYLILLLIKDESALFQAIVTTISTPLSAIVFSFQWLLGPKWSEPLNKWTIIASVLIPIGVIIYKIDNIEEDGGKRRIQETEIFSHSPEPRRMSLSARTPLSISKLLSQLSTAKPISVSINTLSDSDHPDAAHSWPGPRAFVFETPSSRWL